MRPIAVLIPALPAIAASLAATLPAAPAAAQQGRNVTCESWNYREARCPVPGAERVQLQRVMGGQCIEGETWIHDGQAIRVRGGCRAQFRVDDNHGWGTGGWDQGWNGTGAGNGSIRLRCESWNFREATCPAAAAISSARITRVIAGDCRDGVTWRWDRRAIHVRGGCRADFELLPAAAGWGNGNAANWQGGGNRPATSLNCESWNYRQAQCPIARGSQVRLSRVLGGNCVEGRSWGRNAGFIWVKDGCRARFELF